MATLYLVRSGSGSESRVDEGHEITLQEVAQLPRPDVVLFSNSLPVISPDEKVNPYAEFRHVVLEVHSFEVSEEFPDTGFYWLPNIRPTECADVLEAEA